MGRTCFASGSLLAPRPLSLPQGGGPASLPSQDRRSRPLGGGDVAGPRESGTIWSSVKSGAKALTL